MSIFSFLGNAVKTVGKVAVGIGKGAVTAATGIQFGGGQSQNNATSQVAQVAPQASPVSPQPSGFVNDFEKIVGLVNQIHPTVGVEHSVDTRGITNGLPSWALPAALGFGALMLLRGNGRR